jgi:hypothetical protein
MCYEFYLTEYNAAYSFESQPTFQRDMSLHLQVERISRARNQRESKWNDCFYANFLLGLFFVLEDGGDKFLRNVV